MCITDRLYALLLRMLRETADAEEILQETFVDAWRRAGEYAASRGSVEAWLITIARSRAIDRIRNRGARLRLVKQSEQLATCLLYTSDAADERSSVDLGGRRI